MIRKPVRLVRYHATCYLGHKFTYHGFTTADYDQREARPSIASDFAYVDCHTQPVCKEVSRLVDEVMADTGETEWRKRECFTNVFGYICDPAPSGERYRLKGRPDCPVCGQAVETYVEDDPPVIETVDLWVLSSNGWNRMDEAERRLYMEEVLKEVGCLP